MMMLKGRIAFPRPLIDCLSIRDKFQRIISKGCYMYKTIQYTGTGITELDKSWNRNTAVLLYNQLSGHGE